MADFSYLEKQKIKSDKTRELTLFNVSLPGSDENPTLIGKHAGDGNKPFLNATLKRSSTKRNRQIASGKMTPAMIEEGRAEDCELFSKHVIMGWRNVVDSKGEEVKFSQETCLDFLNALPSFVLDEVRAFFGDPLNFMDDSVGVEDAIEKGK